MVRVRNVSRNVDLALNTERADRWWTRMIGLRGRTGLERGHGLIIEPCSSVHTAFMRFSIDVVYFDSALRVTNVAPRLKPFRLSGALRGARGVIELPSGTIEETDTRPGDQLQMQSHMAS